MAILLLSEFFFECSLSESVLHCFFKLLQASKIEFLFKPWERVTEAELGDKRGAHSDPSEPPRLTTFS